MRNFFDSTAIEILEMIISGLCCKAKEYKGAAVEADE